MALSRSTRESVEEQLESRLKNWLNSLDDTNVVKELCTGKLFRFEDQGQTTLKGFPELVRLFTLEGP